MRKIYPPFNKFVGFLLYGLLSIAVITLAQESNAFKCRPIVNPPKVVIGYVQFFTNQPHSEIANVNRWDLYDYINIIAYPKGQSPWNSIHPPDDAGALEPIRTLVSTKTGPKFLLSLRNYDPKEWPANDAAYNELSVEIIDKLTELGLGGVDIEYPGMRGSLCDGPNGPNGPIWDKARDAGFANFVVNLRTKLVGKTLMLTVGSESEMIVDQRLKDNIDYLNIETYHFSLYENLRNFDPANPNFIVSHPNAPLDVFSKAYDAWKTINGVNDDKIIMGVDFGSTFQIVSNPEIAVNQEVSFNPPGPPADENFRKAPNLKDLKEINGLCPDGSPIDDKVHLYTFPRKILSQFVDNCNTTTNGWAHKFDDATSFTPWIYRKDVPPLEPPNNNNNNNNYQYVSYEDYLSLSKKLSSKPIGGISISDVGYDNDGSLLNYISRETASPDPATLNPTGSGKGKDQDPTSSPTDPSINPPGSSNVKSSHTGGIIGGVFGSLGLIILGACGFYFYRYRTLPKSSSFRSLLKFNKGFPNSGNHAISRNPEMTSEPTLAPPTTVIPVASGYVTAMFDFTGKEENDLSFKKGDKIEVLERGDGPNDWWVGRVNGAVGEFPGNYVKET